MHSPSLLWCHATSLSKLIRELLTNKLIMLRCEHVKQNMTEEEVCALQIISHFLVLWWPLICSRSQSYIYAMNSLIRSVISFFETLFFWHFCSFDSRSLSYWRVYLENWGWGDLLVYVYLCVNILQSGVVIFCRCFTWYVGHCFLRV